MQFLLVGMFLLAQAATDHGLGDATTNVVGFGLVGTILFVLNQICNMAREARKEKREAKKEEQSTENQNKKDQLAIRREELALCTEEDQNIIKAYETLLDRTNKQLAENTIELKEVKKELDTCQLALGECKRDHALAQQRAETELQWRKHFEERVALVENKYMVLRKKLPGIDSDSTLTVPEDQKKP